MRKMIKCRCCGAAIAPDAERCPHCGKTTLSYNLAEVVKGIILAPFMAILIILAVCFYVGLFSVFK